MASSMKVVCPGCDEEFLVSPQFERRKIPAKGPFCEKEFPIEQAKKVVRPSPMLLGQRTRGKPWRSRRSKPRHDPTSAISGTSFLFWRRPGIFTGSVPGSRKQRADAVSKVAISGAAG